MKFKPYSPQKAGKITKMCCLLTSLKCFKYTSTKVDILIKQQAFSLEHLLKIDFLISQPKHVEGTQMNHLNETVLLSTQNTCLNGWVRKYLQFYDQVFVGLNL